MTEYAGRFWSKVEKGLDDECWPWANTKSRGGYGQFKLDGKMVQAHRVSFLLANGSIDDDMVVDHECQNRACCNPKHLRQLTGKQNTLVGTGPTAANAAKERCPEGHEYDEVVGNGDGQDKRSCSVCRKRHAAARQKRYRDRKRELVSLI